MMAVLRRFNAWSGWVIFETIVHLYATVATIIIVHSESMSAALAIPMLMIALTVDGARLRLRSPDRRAAALAWVDNGRWRWLHSNGFPSRPFAGFFGTVLVLWLVLPSDTCIPAISDSLLPHFGQLREKLDGIGGVCSLGGSWYLFTSYVVMVAVGWLFLLWASLFAMIDPENHRPKSYDKYKLPTNWQLVRGGVLLLGWPYLIGILPFDPSLYVPGRTRTLAPHEDFISFITLSIGFMVWAGAQFHLASIHDVNQRRRGTP